MNILVYLVPVALGLGLTGLAAFLWSLRAGQYDPARGNALAWLSGIVRHLALDAARARGREVASDDALLEMPSLEPGAFDILAADSDARQLQVCLAELDERSRGVITCRMRTIPRY